MARSLDLCRRLKTIPVGKTLASACLCLVIGQHEAHAQAVKATVVGIVTDSTGAVVPGSLVRLQEQATGAHVESTTNNSGSFAFPDLSPGTWIVIASHAGFKTAEQDQVIVPVNSTVRVELHLAPGDATETITVTSQRTLLQTDRADVSASIEAKQVEDLPLGNNRNPQALQALLPGVSAPLYTHTSFANPQNAQSFHVNGQAVFASSVEIEGIDDNERTGQLSVYIPPAAAVQTLNVSTSNYEAEFGRALGAVTNFILKSGTNRVHGSLYEYNEISALAANNYFNSGAKTRLVNNYFGGTIGGPIWKDHTFFFADVLRSTNHSQDFNLVSVPTLAYRNGDFSGSPTKVYDPNTGTSTGAGRTQFFSTGGVANVLPQNRINPIAAAMLALVPLPNVPGNTTLVNNYQANTNFNDDTTSVDFKLDHRLHSDSLSYRYSYQTAALLFQPIFGLGGGPAGSGQPGAAGTGQYHLWNTAAEYVHPFSQSLLTEVRVGVDHYVNVIHQTDFGTDDTSAIGLPNGNPDPFNSGFPEIRVSAFSSPLLGYYASYPAKHAETNVNIVNNWTKTIGNHILKFGAEVRRLRDDQKSSLLSDPRGNYSFSYGTTSIPGATTSASNSLASFLLGVPGSFSQQTVLGEQTWRQTLYFGFLQDTWNALPHLTLTAGVRWEAYPPANPNRQGGFSQYDFASNTLQLSGYGNEPNDLGLDFNKTDFAPRFGFAYRPHETTVVRGGYGISYAPYLDNRYAYGNYPVQQNVSYAALNTYTAALNPAGQPLTLQQGLPVPQQVIIPSNGTFVAPISSSYNIVNTHYRDPYLMSYNFTVQQALPYKVSFDIGFVGNQGRQIPETYNLNAGQILGAGAAGQPQYATLKRTASSLLFYKTDVSSYNSLQSRLQRQFSNGLSFTASYTWQKSIGYNSTSGAISQPSFYVDYHRNHAVLNYNHMHQSTQSIVYELPFGKGKPFLGHGIGAAIAGGWQISSILSEYTGSPLTFTAATTSLNTPSATQVANQIAPFHKLFGIGTGKPWFDTTAFTQPLAAGVYGNTGINVYSGPGSFNMDASIFRSFFLWEQASLRVRLDALHATNTPNFGNPSTGVDSASFGIVSSAAGSRVIQIAGEIRF